MQSSSALAETLDDANRSAPPIEVSAVLTDGDLSRGGLASVRAWVRTKPGANAQRQARKRERQQAQGLAQITVVAPAEAKPALHAVAKALAAEALAPAMIGRLGAVLAAGGWRARLLRWLLA